MNSPADGLRGLLIGLDARLAAKAASLVASSPSWGTSNEHIGGAVVLT